MVRRSGSALLSTRRRYRLNTPLRSDAQMSSRPFGDHTGKAWFQSEVTRVSVLLVRSKIQRLQVRTVYHEGYLLPIGRESRCAKASWLLDHGARTVPGDRSKGRVCRGSRRSRRIDERTVLRQTENGHGRHLSRTHAFDDRHWTSSRSQLGKIEWNHEQAPCAQINQVARWAVAGQRATFQHDGVLSSRSNATAMPASSQDCVSLLDTVNRTVSPPGRNSGKR